MKIANPTIETLLEIIEAQASTKTATYYHVSPKQKSLIDGLSGTVVHDHWKNSG